MGFRADINGLRALAVLAVLAFHFGIPGFGGGFIGVDVFFVISGYLMTGIIVGRNERGTFSLPGFYLERGLRILPPLAVMVAAVLVVGLILLLPQELLALGKHAVGAVLFLSNFLFWSEISYFAPQAKLNWLLHTWSLSAEWQFYILYPIIIIVVRLFGGLRTLTVTLLGIAVLSFALSLVLSRYLPTMAFFLLPSRAWEMIAGGLIYLLPALPARFTRVAQLTGLAMILASIGLAVESNWPGIWALAPVLGTALVIAAGRTESRLTGNRIASWVGLNSYSIYLWHWPIAVFIAYNHWAGDWRAIVGGIFLSLILGHLSWRFIERGGRRNDRRPRIHTGLKPFDWRSCVALVGVAAILSLAGASIWKLRGLPGRFSPEVRAIEADAKPGGLYNRECFAVVDGPACIIGPSKTDIAAILIGDSHADADASGVVAALPPGTSLEFSGYMACPPLLDISSADPENRCRDFLRARLAPLSKPRTTPVILISYWPGVIEGRNILFGDGREPFSVAEYQRRLLDTSCTLAKAGPTYVMLPTPQFPLPVAPTLQHRLRSDPNAAEMTLPVADYKRQIQPIVETLKDAERLCGVRLLDPAPFICPDGKSCMGSDQHRALFRDTHHMTEFGNKYLTPMFRTVFSK